VAVALLDLSATLLARVANRAMVTSNSLTRRRSMKALVARFVREESGQDLIEYGLLVGIITTATITAITAVGGKVQQYFVNLNSLLPTR
jgi:pilus assembly protein Flp/PilA